MPRRMVTFHYNQVMSKREKIEYGIITGILIVGYAFLLAFAFTRLNEWRLAEAREYLGKAKITDSNQERLLSLERAALLYPSEETYLPTGVLLLETGQYDIASRYLSRVKTAEGYYQLGTTYYNLQQYDRAVSAYMNSNESATDNRTYLGLAKSYLKLGNVDQAKSILSHTKGTDPATPEISSLYSATSLNFDDAEAAKQVVAAYNNLNKLGYPQAAKTVLQEAQKKERLNRESYILLANEEMMKGEYALAYDYLQSARSIDPYYPQIYKQLATICQRLGKVEEANQNLEYYNKITF